MICPASVMCDGAHNPVIDSRNHSRFKGGGDVSSLRLLQIAFVACLFALTVPLSRGENWPPISPEELKMTSIAEQPGAPAVVLLRQEVDDDIKKEHAFYERIKVLTEAGRKYADVEIPYVRRQFNITISGRTVHSDGTIVNAEGKPFDKEVLKTHGMRVREKVFSLPDVQVGSILDIRYTLSYDDHSLWAPDWDVQTDLFQKKAIFKFVPYTDEWTNPRGQVGQGVAWTPYIPAGQPQPKLNTSLTGSMAKRGENGDSVDLTLENVPPLIEEPYTPPRSLLRWRVNFYYRTSAKPAEFWKDEGKYWNKEVESFVGHKDGITQALSSIILPNDTPELKVRKIYAYVSNMENRSFRPDRPVAESNALGLIDNKNVEDVLRQHSGTHDDLNRLFVAMVRAVDIPAWLMRVADRSERIFVPSYLSTDQFAAELAIVQLNGKDVFLDPGTRFCPYGLLTWHYSGVDGLRQSASKGTETATASFPGYKDVMIQRKAVLTLAADGSESGTVTVGYFGLEGMDRRQQAAQTDAAGRKKLLEDEIKSWLPGGSEVTLQNEPRWEAAETPLVAVFKVSGPLAVGAGKRAVVPLHIFEVNDPPMFPAAERTNPIYFYNPSCVIDEVHLTVPQGTSIESLPQNDTVHLEYAAYESQQKMEQPMTILATREIIMDGIAFPKDRYKELKTFYDKVSTDDGEQVILKAAAHAEGN